MEQEIKNAMENIDKAESEAAEQLVQAAEEPGTNETTKRGVITFSRPYLFERTEYTEIDLSGVEALTVQDVIDAQREVFNEKETAAMTVCETTTAFTRKLASRASGLPIEFFKLAPRRISRRVVATVHA